MSNTPITINDKPIEVQLGSLLQLKTAKYEKGITELKITKDGMETIYKIGNTNSIPPIMVAIEIVKENTKTGHLLNETTGKPLKSPIKVLCQWFSQNTNQFHERWLELDVLKVVQTEEKIVDTKTDNPKDGNTSTTTEINNSEFEVGNIVSLRSIDYSEEFIETLKKGVFPTISEDNAENDADDKSKIKTVAYKITRTFKDASYSPPKMLITAINEILEKDKKPLYNKSTGERSRYTTTTNVKCMWYDHKKGKYSEHTFAKEALTLLKDEATEDLIEDKILAVFREINDKNANI